MNLTQLVIARDAGACARCRKPVSGQRGRDWSIHHRRPRAMGGTRRPDTAANLIILCGSGTTGCHGWVESHRAAALEAGWLVSQWADPALVPMVRGDRRVLLTADGGVA